VASTGVRNDPALALRFEVALDDLPVGGFSECGGLQSEIEVHDHPEGGLNTHLHKFPTRSKQSNITLRRGIVDRLLWDWYADMLAGRVVVRDGSIRIRAPSGQGVAVEWQFRGAFPCKWVGPELNATQNAVAVETFELCHQGLERTT
jgi:phage tail-like protein